MVTDYLYFLHPSTGKISRPSLQNSTRMLLELKKGNSFTLVVSDLECYSLGPRKSYHKIFSWHQKMLYINGATTDPCVTTINVPIRTIVMINGANQYFLRTFKKSQMSLTRSRNASMVQKMRVRSVRLFLRFSLYVVSPFRRRLNGSYPMRRIM